MIVRNSLTFDIPSLKLTDSVEYALIMMEDFSVSNLPIVNNKSLIGYAISEVLNGLDSNLLLSDLTFEGTPITINPNHSVINALKLLSDNNFDVIASVERNEYVGLVWSKDLIKGLGQSATAQNDGSVLLLRCNIFNYSISEIGRLVEVEDGKILGLWTWQNDQTQDIDILIKLNIRHIDTITHVLRTHNYEILYQINQKADDLFEDRYRSLINYLDI